MPNLLCGGGGGVEVVVVMVVVRTTTPNYLRLAFRNRGKYLVLLLYTYRENRACARPVVAGCVRASHRRDCDSSAISKLAGL